MPNIQPWIHLSMMKLVFLYYLQTFLTFLDDSTYIDDNITPPGENGNRRITWPRITQQGPNINIKVPRKSFSSQEERLFFTKQITMKQKTEVSHLLIRNIYL